MIKPFATYGELHNDLPIKQFLVESIDGTQFVNRSGLTDAQIKEVFEGMHRQTLIQAEIQESTGYSNELGIDPFRNGFVVTSDYGDGKSNEQLFIPNASDFDMGILRYSLRSGRWSGNVLHEPSVTTTGEKPATITVGPTEHRVPWLPPGISLTPPGPGRIDIFVPPAIIGSDGKPHTARPSRDNQVPEGTPPAPTIHLPNLIDSKPVTNVTTPNDGTILIGGTRDWRGGDGDGERRGAFGRITFDIAVGYSGVSFPQVGTGTHINDLGDELFLLKSPSFLSGYNIGGKVVMPVDIFFPNHDKSEQQPTDETAAPSDNHFGHSGGKLRPYLYLEGGYTSASGDSSAAVQPGGDVTAVTFPDLTSPSDFTGIGLGMTGLEGIYNTDFSQWNIDIGGG